MSVVMNFLRGRLSLIVLPSAARLRSQWIKRISKIVFLKKKKKNELQQSWQLSKRVTRISAVIFAILSPKQRMKLARTP